MCTPGAWVRELASGAAAARRNTSTSIPSSPRSRASALVMGAHAQQILQPEPHALLDPHSSSGQQSGTSAATDEAAPKAGRSHCRGRRPLACPRRSVHRSAATWAGAGSSRLVKDLKLRPVSPSRAPSSTLDLAPAARSGQDDRPRAAGAQARSLVPAGQRLPQRELKRTLRQRRERHLSAAARCGPGPSRLRTYSTDCHASDPELCEDLHHDPAVHAGQREHEVLGSDDPMTHRPGFVLLASDDLASLVR